MLVGCGGACIRSCELCQATVDKFAQMGAFDACLASSCFLTAAHMSTMGKIHRAVGFCVSDTPYVIGVRREWLFQVLGCSACQPNRDSRIDRGSAIITSLDRLGCVRSVRTGTMQAGLGRACPLSRHLVVLHSSKPHTFSFSDELLLICAHC